MQRSPDEAVEFERSRSVAGLQLPEGDCLGSVRDAYFGAGAHAFGGTAASAFSATTSRHGVYETPPLGALVWFTGGSTGAGHVGISNGAGYFWTTDFGLNGYIGDGRIRLVPIAAINQHNPALKYVGWTDDIDGVVVLNMTDADKKYIRDVVVGAMTAIMWGANPAGTADVLGIPDTGSWNTAVKSDNIKAQVDRVITQLAATPPGTASPIDLDALATAVADKLAARLVN